MQNNRDSQNTLRNNVPINLSKNKILCQWISETNVAYEILMN